MDELVAKTWHKIQQEAECMAAQEPMLASFFHSTILNHKNLRSALSFQLANKLDSATMPAIALREVIDRFAHRHLNADCPEFASLNPSVENIARVCHGLLEGPVRAGGAALHRVTVWETEKTSATFPAA